MSSCPFCVRIRHGEFDQAWEHAAMFEPLNPVTPGHRLVVSRRHVADATTDPDITAEVMRVAARLAGESTESCNLITSIGAAATQTVWHLHVHIVPRRLGDGLTLPWTAQEPP